MNRRKTFSRWLSVRACLFAACGLAGGMSALAGEKVLLSNPDKGPVLPPKNLDQPGRDKAPFDFFDRGNSVGGVVDAPSATPSAGPGDPRAQRKLLEVLEKQKSWASQDGRTPEQHSEDHSKDADFSEASWESLGDQALTDDLSGRGRFGGDLEVDEAGQTKTSNADRRRSNQGSHRSDRNGQNGDHDHRDRSKSGSSTDDRSGSTIMDNPPGFGERVQFSDPFGTSVGTGRADVARSPFDLGASRATTLGADPAVAAVDPQRQQQFQQLLGGDMPRTGLDGLGMTRTAAERNTEFRALLTGGSGSTGTPSFGSPLDSTKPAGSILPPPRSTLPSSLLPSPAAGPSLFEPPAPVVPPPAALKPQPAILPFPKRF